MTAAPTPTRASSGPKPETHGGRGGARDLSTWVVGAIAIGIALTWVVALFLHFRQGTMVEGVWVYAMDDAWGFVVEAYLAAAARLMESGF